MRFDLVDLRLFVAVAEARSITHGAERSALALASASARIKGMEVALGVPLLKRERRGVELTAAGESLLDHARIVLHDIEALQGDLAAYARGMKAHIHMLSNTAGMSEHLPKVLSAYLVQNPNISINVEERESPHIGQAIASGVADIGLAAGHVVPDNLERFAFCDDRLILVTPPADPFNGRRQIDYREVLDRDFVGLSEGSALQDHIASHAARQGKRIRLRARVRTFDAVCQMVEAGVGVAMMPEVAARRAMKTMKVGLVRIRDAWTQRQLVVCMRSFKALPRPAQQLVQHLRASASI
ncbi:LysR substrate-binding domain-containing protein [Bradyrhizobium prioriisuperbiae]|uniref:LysR substrate-binding domain-containing protein n=1 Tax=Bradyrhizobium prioriisuperbiae TaxID=2854389 RepID=UPI0028EB7E1F|nr:LysR substrate-binding domain-containing protein [Bradyrhizobium prioritasuperba]